MTTPAALAPALAAWPAMSSMEAAATFARAAMSSRIAISPMLTGVPSIAAVPYRKGHGWNPRTLRRVPARPEGRDDALVASRRDDRRHGGPRPRHVRHIPGVDRRRPVARWRTGGGPRRGDVHPARVRLRPGARVRPHLRGAALRHPHSGRDPLAHRRGRESRAHSA